RFHQVQPAQEAVLAEELDARRLQCADARLDLGVGRFVQKPATENDALGLARDAAPQPAAACGYRPCCKALREGAERSHNAQRRYGLRHEVVFPLCSVPAVTRAARALAAGPTASRPSSLPATSQPQPCWRPPPASATASWPFP